MAPIGSGSGPTTCDRGSLTGRADGRYMAAMFGIPSLGKLLVLVAIVLAVWFGFQFIGRLDRLRKDEARLKKRAGASRGKAAGKAAAVEDTVKCPTCGAYVSARSSSSCGRADCPY